MEPDDGPEDDSPLMPLLPPDDRLWRHPSEMHPIDDLVAPGPAVGPTRTHGGEARRVWGVALVAGIVGALAASGVGMATGMFEQQTTVIRSVTPQAPSLSLASDSGSSIDWTSVDDTLAPSVVAINVASSSGPATGSGMMFIEGTSSSYIITNNSLVEDGGPITVSFLSGETVRARLVGADRISGLALVSVPNSFPNRQGIFPILGSVADLQVANPVLAIGARTSLGGSVFAGSVGAEDRKVNVTGGQAMQNMIASTASRIPDTAGGGPLVDAHGRVVGITLALDPTDVSDQGLTFAVPIDVAERVAQEMLSGGAVAHPWLGITDAVDLSSAVAHQLGLSGGAQIGQVAPGSPASRVGLNTSDIVTSFNGLPVTSTGTLTRILAQCQPGKSAPISYMHNGSPRSATVLVANQPGGY